MMSASRASRLPRSRCSRTWSIVDDLALQPLGQLSAWMSGNTLRTRAITLSRFAAGATLCRCRPPSCRRSDFGIVVLGAERHVGDVAQPNDRSALLLDDEIL